MLLLALTNAKLWVLDRGIYQLITQRLGLQRHETLMQFLHHVPLLRGLPEDRISKIADSLEQVNSKRKENLAREETNSNYSELQHLDKIVCYNVAVRSFRTFIRKVLS